MNTKLTEHAKIRFRQRGINNLVLDCVIQYGDVNHAPGGAEIITFTNRNADKEICILRKEIQKLERARGVAVIQKDGCILTGYRKS